MNYLCIGFVPGGKQNKDELLRSVEAIKPNPLAVNHDLMLCTLCELQKTHPSMWFKALKKTTCPRGPRRVP